MPIADTRQQDKREAILEAALALFTERGFHGTAVPLVAERAHVGAGTIYRYFASKEALVNALYQEQKAAVVAFVMRDFPLGATFREQFHALWQRWAAWAVENPSAFAFLELHHHASYLDEISRGLEQRLMDMVEALVEQAQSAQVLKPLPPHLLMGLIQGAFIGMIRASRDRGQPLTPELIDAAEQCCWEAVRL